MQTGASALRGLVYPRQARSRRASSWDRTGKNRDYIVVEPGETAPSVESPLGDFFGVGHARVSHYVSLPLSMITGGEPARANRAAMNCFFPMPFAAGVGLPRKSGTIAKIWRLTE